MNLVDWLVANEPSFRKIRLPSLYSDLIQQKAANPDGFAANVTAWESALKCAALAGQLPNDQKFILECSDELLNALSSPQYGRPSGLGAVFDEAIRDKKMIELGEFKSVEQSIYHKSWIPSPWKMLKWGLRQTGLVGSGSYDIEGRLKKGQLVLVEALEEVSKQVLAAQAQQGQTLPNRLMSKEDFSQQLGKISDTHLSATDIDILLRYLSRDKLMLSYNGQTVKFKPSTATMPEAITAEDATIATMKSLISSLQQQTSTLSDRISLLQSNAKTAVKTGNKQTAMSSLKSKKLAENALQQRSDQLYQLEEVYARIEQAVDQVQIVEAMEASSHVLKGLNKRVGGLERVDNVMDDLREQIGQVDEVGQVLQEPVGDKMAVDDIEVDDELEAMEKDEARAREEKEAEATRQRLQALENTGPTKPLLDANDSKTEAQLQKDTEILDKMHIDSEGEKQQATSNVETRTAQEAL